MTTTSTTPRPGAAAIIASAIGVTIAQADISRIDGSIQLDGRTEVQSGGVFVDAEDQVGSNIAANDDQGIDPLDAVFGYDHGLSLASASAQQAASSGLFFNDSTLGFEYQSSARVESGPDTSGESARLSGRFDAGFSVETDAPTTLDIVIGIVYTPGASPSDDFFASISIDGIPDQPDFAFRIDETDAPFSAELEIRTTLEAERPIGVRAESMYDMQTSGGDQGMADIADLGSIALYSQITVAPSPAPFALLGLGSLAAARRRR